MIGHIDHSKEEALKTKSANDRLAWALKFTGLISTNALLSQDTTLLRLYLEELTTQKEIVYAAYTTSDGTPIALESKLDLKQMTTNIKEKHQLAVDIISFSHNLSLIETPVQFQNDVIGFFIAGVDQDAFLKDHPSYIEHTKEGFVLVIVLGFILAFTFRNNVSRPVKELKRVVEKIMLGSLGEQAIVYSNDDIGQLAYSINKMSTSLRNSEREKNRVLVKLQEANSELKTATEAKSIFLANMSHEIRTPLTSILGFSEYLKSTDVPPEKRNYFINNILNNGNHLLKVINEILDISKIESGNLEIRKQKINLFELIEEIRSSFSFDAQKKDLKFIVNYQFPLPCFLYTDPLRIKQILYNLVGNAFKFTDVGHIRVNVSYYRSDNNLMFDIQDTGIGINKKELTSIFDAFVQADTSSARRFEGTGLGLAISRKLAMLLGGNISVVSVFGKGSQFSCSLNPGALSMLEFVDERPASIEVNDQSSLKDSNEGACSARILVVDDAKDNQILIVSYLKKLGCTTDTADNGEAALETLKQKQFDLIVMDKQMPGMDGMETTRKIRSSGLQTPIIALTADALQEDKQNFLDAGCNDYMTKPIQFKLFVSKLKKLLPDHWK